MNIYGKDFHREDVEQDIFEEKMIFLSLSCPSDVDLILKKKPMSLMDFSRLIHLVTTLGFWHLCQDFIYRFENLLPEYIADPKRQIAIEMEHISEWESDFLDNLPSQEMRPYLAELFFN